MSPHISTDDDPSLDLFTSGGEKWKRYRTIMNLTFTWTKIKEVSFESSHSRINYGLVIVNLKCIANSFNANV